LNQEGEYYPGIDHATDTSLIKIQRLRRIRYMLKSENSPKLNREIADLLEDFQSKEKVATSQEYN